MIYWTQRTEAQEIHGQILDKWSEMGFERSLLGYPAEDEKGTPDGVGRFNRFERGMIYWTPNTGAHEVHGFILDKWTSLGFERSFLGYPVSDEEGTPDGIGRFSRFQGGMIYSTANAGTHEVHGDILAKWASLGFERSFLRYPTTDESDLGVNGGRFNNFERGQISWPPTAGADVASAVEPQPGSSGIRPQGLPGDGRPEIRRRVIASAHMDIIDSENFGSDERGSADQQAEVFLSNKQPRGLMFLVGKAGGEVRIELNLNASATTEGDVQITGDAKLFEGTSEESDDLDGTTPVNFTVPRDEILTNVPINVRNTDEGGDFANIILTVNNFAA